MTILDECFDSHTPIPNKRLLHSSLSQLSKSPSLPPVIRRDVEKCFPSLNIVEDGPFVLVEIETVESMEAAQTSLAELQQQHEELRNKLGERDDTIIQLEKEKTNLIEKEKTFLSTLQSLQREKDQIQRENERNQRENEKLRGECDKRVVEMQRTMEEMRDQLDAHIGRIGAKECIVAFSSSHFRVSGSTVTRINSFGWAGCFTKTVSKGIHRLSIKTKAQTVMLGILDAAEFPKLMTADVSASPKAAMMYSKYGSLWSADKRIALNAQPEKGQEWSAEADLEKRTLHFFIDGVQQQHHFVNLPVPLVFALDVHNEDGSVEITFWGELRRSNVTFWGTGHNLG